MDEEEIQNDGERKRQRLNLTFGNIVDNMSSGATANTNVVDYLVDKTKKKQM